MIKEDSQNFITPTFPEEIEKVRATLKQSIDNGRLFLSLKYPGEVEYYYVALELIDTSTNDTIDYFAFPVNPSSINKRDIYVNNVQKTYKGIVVNKMTDFYPQQLTITGNFGQKWKLISKDDKDIKFRSDANYYAAGLNGGELSSKVKNGYGCVKYLQRIIERAQHTEDNRVLRTLLFHNYTFGETYTVEIENGIEFSMTESSNMIWNYRLGLHIVKLVKIGMKASNALTNALIEPPASLINILNSKVPVPSYTKISEKTNVFNSFIEKGSSILKKSTNAINLVITPLANVTSQVNKWYQKGTSLMDEAYLLYNSVYTQITTPIDVVKNIIYTATTTWSSIRAFLGWNSGEGVIQGLVNSVLGIEDDINNGDKLNEGLSEINEYIEVIEENPNVDIDYPKEAVQTLEITSELVDTVYEQIESYKDSFSSANVSQLNRYDIFELNDFIEELKFVLDAFKKALENVSNNSGRYLYSTALGETVEHAASEVGYEDRDQGAMDILMKGRTKETDYGINEGSYLFRYDFQDEGRQYSLRTVVGNAYGENAYGKDIKKKITFVDNDIEVLEPRKTFEQSCQVLLSLKKGDNPEFPYQGIDKTLLQNRVIAAMTLPILIRQLTETIGRDDTISKFSLDEISYSQNAFYGVCTLQSQLNNSYKVELS